MTNFILISLGELVQLIGKSTTQRILNKFSCNKEPELEQFLQNNAILYQKIEYGKTFLLLDRSYLDRQIKIAAFFTIAQQSVSIKNLSKNQKRKILGQVPGRDKLNSIACYLIGQIGRDDNYSHKDLPGSTIIEQCYEQINVARKQVGGKLLILECRPKMYKLFYKKQDFKRAKNIVIKDNKLITLYRRLK